MIQRFLREHECRTSGGRIVQVWDGAKWVDTSDLPEEEIEERIAIFKMCDDCSHVLGYCPRGDDCALYDFRPSYLVEG